MSERKVSGQQTLLPEWAWRALAGLMVSLGIVRIIYSLSTERWTSACWSGVVTIVMAALFLRRLRRHSMAPRPTAHSGDASPAALSWDDPKVKRGAAIFVLVGVGAGLLGVAWVLRGAGMGSVPSKPDQWIALIGGPLLAFIGFGASARVIGRWRRRAAPRRS